MKQAVMKQGTDHPLTNGYPPVWASGWGQDRYGVFVEFTVEDITQRLRWIPPGEFHMGSASDEPGRWKNEGPRHRVILEQGYWLFDTLCTQALWQAVMDDNPSRFPSPDRPVESVSWERVDTFMEEITGRIPGLHLLLPTEAQWEYACRGGTDAPTYAGPMEILGANHAPILDAIAWYGGNSGLDFELDNGYDSSSWQEKQYPHERVGTHPVGRKRPNALGLYDMLGNVWEWCRDGRREYEEGSNTDPMGSGETGAKRTVRGGSWNSSARNVRAAVRRWGLPGTYNVSLGFRGAVLSSAAAEDGESEFEE
uniref:Formylglycine-generating enzyme, required for sulfatase activity, contains SUMF1/FGE domain n=1 Tax=Candidatus Kentrum sp. FM TaxID=2126340 RepID=A0A450TF66_9GAMM|nr:MAG: Formylglycine-generating enzyme, required for sulfatase activity, contains SUMF1/FGE domain [Candidatus Kentron sp. FM]VFJ69926.1 MAG: Formylglycine-generating enzyme, required for sulfatase activity, contains SUMF1/FGE domain [Candidatus Kentron sp. FM]VFK17494.1 MAG: Formylglycine-generating enzyme, required for sulfatase activity, contains SUMF1/FGE domain [Candidatus Kentron sp. FM]